MAKKTYYFSHDMNARHDPKIIAMRGKYGAEGYGWFWVLVEMMAEAEDYKLDCKSKYIWSAYAMQMQCKCIEDAQNFIMDCINEFELFVENDGFFFSKTLVNRMKKLDDVKEKRKAAANARWNKENDANAYANAMQNNAKERKGKESKENKIINKQQHNAFSVYQNEIGVLSSHIGDKVGKWIDEFEDGQAIVIYAIECAVEANKRNWGYCEMLLKEWHSKGAKNLDQCKAIRSEFVRRGNHAADRRSDRGNVKKNPNHEGTSYTTWKPTGEPIDTTGIF